MTSRICEICHEGAVDTYTYQISDDKEKYMVTGHKHCIDKFEQSYKSISNYSKKSVKQCLSELNIRE